MGTGSSVQPKQGALANPRILYAEKLSKKNKKQYAIDAPVLIDLQHGSIRYRYDTGPDQPPNKAKMVEMPYEGDQMKKKGHYFYHPRLNDFSEKASIEKEEPHKLMCVMKGPNSVKQKKIFYVYGRGWNARDGNRTNPTQTRAMGPDPTWPARQNPNDVYYDITFIDQVPTEEPIAGIPNRSKIEFALTDKDNVNSLRTKIAHNILKSGQYIHICYQQKELQGDVNIAMLQQNAGGLEIFAARVTLMDP